MMLLEHDLLTNPLTAKTFSELPRTKRIIDVGCGIRPCQVFPVEEYVCIEPHEEYRDHLQDWKTPGKLTIVPYAAEALTEQPREGSTVLLIDVIEHMERPRGEKIRDLVGEFEHSVIFTPLGWYPQDYEDPDCWGLHGGYWQKHRSEWHPEDFEGWNVKVWEHWHPKNGVGAILAIK